jgi:hypothetical protein
MLSRKDDNNVRVLERSERSTPDEGHESGNFTEEYGEEGQSGETWKKQLLSDLKPSVHRNT